MGGRLFKKYYFTIFKSIILMVLIAFGILFYNTLDNINEERIDSFYDVVLEDKIDYSLSVIDRTIQGIEMERELINKNVTDEIEEVVDLIKEYISVYKDIDISNDPIIIKFLKSRDYCNVILLKNGNIIYNSCPNSSIDDIAKEEYIVASNNWINGNDTYKIMVFVANEHIDVIVRDSLKKRIRNTVLMNNRKITLYKINDTSGKYKYMKVIVNMKNPLEEGTYLDYSERDNKGNEFRKKELKDLLDTGVAISDIYLSENNLETHRYVVSKYYKNYNWVISISFDIDDVEKIIEKEKENLESLRWKEVVLFLCVLIVMIGFVYVIYSIIELRDRIKKENYRLIEAGKVMGNELLAMRDKANLDPLTNLYNRRAIEEKFVTFMTKNQFVDYSVLMCDVDDFKSINDQYGHETGDCVLKLVANTIGGTLRKEDVVSRWGGDEFLVVLFDSDKLTSMIVAEKLKKAIEKVEINCVEGNLKITISIGIAKSYGGLSYQEVISLADVALYKSKNAGKNCITFMEK